MSLRRFLIEKELSGVEKGFQEEEGLVYNRKVKEMDRVIRK